MQDRFKDFETGIWDFESRVLIRCPKCDQCAIAEAMDVNKMRYTCGACGMAQEVPPGKWVYTKNAQGGANVSLWLETKCCGHLLWAYNREHLEFLEAYVSALLREQRPSPDGRWHNAALASRLPKWMSSAKNREDVLKGIERLKERLPEI